MYVILHRWKSRWVLSVGNRPDNWGGANAVPVGSNLYVAKVSFSMRPVSYWRYHKIAEHKAKYYGPMVAT